MPKYVDGFVLPVQKRKLEEYKRISKKACKVWLDNGALEYRECVGEDLNVAGLTPFSSVITCKRGETIMFSWIVYRSRKHRDKVNAKVMADPRMAALCKPGAMPFDVTRMCYGGFEVLLEGVAAGR